MKPRLQDILIPVKLEQEIGQEGKNSSVYLATEINIGRQIVIKEVKRTHLNINYFEEAKYLYQSKHPHIVEMSYAGESGCKQYVYLAMPYYSNGSLNKKINTGLSVNQIIKYSLDFLSGLNNIHQKKLVHLDIKPDNILISEKNEALLSDFGLVHKLGMFGTAKMNKGIFPPLIAPENIIHKHDKSSHYTDIYQVGITLFLMMNQKNLEIYLNENNVTTDNLGYLISSGKLYNSDDYAYHIPDKIRKIINKCLSIKPEKRPKSVQDLLNELSDIEPHHSLDWEYIIKGTNKYWENKTLKINCSLTINGDIVIFKNNKKTYSGNDLKKLLEIFV